MSSTYQNDEALSHVWLACPTCSLVEWHRLVLCVLGLLALLEQHRLPDISLLT